MQSHFKSLLDTNFRFSLTKPKSSSSKTPKNISTVFSLKHKTPHQKLSANLQSSKIKHFLANDCVRQSQFRKHSDSSAKQFDINRIDALIHKYHKSNLKQTFIMNSENKKIRCKTDIVDIFKEDLLTRKESKNSLFDDEDISHMVIFDKKNVEAIETEETILSFDNSIISYGENDKTMDENDLALLPFFSPHELLKIK